MSHVAANADRLLDLAGAVCNGFASVNDVVELNSILRDDRSSRRRYVDYCWIHVALRTQLRARRAAQRAHQRIDVESGVVAAGNSNAATIETPSAMPLGFLSTTFSSTIGYSSGWPVSYLIATAITGLLILSLWLMPISRPEQVATHSMPPATERQLAPEPLSKPVGRITGLVDCKWNGASHVFLGQKCQLASGLMEITYNTGAKVILQGPVTYEVESNGGYLSLGKLTGKLEHSFNREPAASVSVASKSEIRNQKSEMSAFAVRTPTAIVTDLGTEFGIEVRDRDAVNVVVFDGTVKVADSDQRANRLITTGEAVQIRAGAITRTEHGTPSMQFVRAIPPRGRSRPVWSGTVLSYDFESPVLRPGNLLEQDRWTTGSSTSLTVGPGTGVNRTQVAGGAGHGDWSSWRRFQWCRQWPQITGADATVTEEFWAYATTPANTDVVMGALWAGDSNPAGGLFGMSKGKWYVRRAVPPGVEFSGDGGIKPSHWYVVRLVIDFFVPGGSATLYHRDVTADETTFIQDSILHGVEMQIPQVPWAPPNVPQYEISGISARPSGYSNDSGQFYLDNFSVQIGVNHQARPIGQEKQP